jgi:hypothetical protein
LSVGQGLYLHVYAFIELLFSRPKIKSDVYINNDFEGDSELNKPSKIAC